MAQRDRHSTPRSELQPGRIALAYLIVSLAWILGSGYVVENFFPQPLIGFLETTKGTGYVLIVAAGLYLILARRAASIRKAEEAREVADAERLRLAAAVEQSSDAVLVTDRQARILYVNPALEKALGLSGAELVGKTPGLFLVDTDGRSVDEGIWPTSGQSTTWRGSLIEVCKDGDRLEVDAFIRPILDSNGEPASHIGVLRDVSREKALERQLAEASRMEVVGQLAGGIAHDFNNLLTAIAGYAELLTAEVADNPAARSDVDEITRASRSAAALVRQLLALARRQMLNPTGLALDDLADQLHPMLAGLLGPRVTLEVKCPERLEPVFADAGQIEQVLVNLTVNARDAMPEGGNLCLEMANVTVGAHDGLSDLLPAGRYVSIAVQDSGTGMDQATLSRVFEPFFTTKPAGQGTGLGLATTYGIVKQSGGYVFAASELGKGSTFTIYLPRYGGSVEEPAPASAGPSPTGKETILIVEDDEAVRALLTETLRRLGYRVLVRSNGEEALADSPGGNSLAMLITDIRLPGQDGTAIAAQLKSAHPGLRVLYVSGYAGDAMISSGLLSPDEAFLPKPFGPDELARRVRFMLDSSPKA